MKRFLLALTLALVLCCAAAYVAQGETQFYTTAAPIPGQDYMVSWAAAPGATQYELTVWTCSDEMETFTTSDTYYTVPARLFADYPPYVTVSLRANDSGRSSAYMEYYLSVPQDPNVKLSVSKTSVLVNEVISVTASAPGAESVTVTDETGPWGESDGSSHDISFEYSSQGVYHLWARARYNGSWSAYCAPATVTVTAYGEVAKPQFTVSGGVIGEPVTVTLSNPDANAENYSVSLYDPDGKYIGQKSMSGEALKNGYAIPDTQFDIPGQYRVYVRANGKPGWVNGYNSQYINMTGGRAAGPAVGLSASTATPAKQITAQATMSGATKFVFDVQALHENGNRYSTMTLDREYAAINGTGTCTFNVPSYWGGKFLQVRARAFVNGMWTSLGEPTTIPISKAPLLASPAVTMPESVAAGEAVYVTISAVENANSYSIEVYRNDERLGSVYCNEAGTYLVPLIADPGSYRVNVTARADGYTNGLTMANLTVRDGTLLSGPMLSASASSVSVNSSIKFTAIYYGAEKLFINVNVLQEDGTVYSYYDTDVYENLEDYTATYQYHASEWYVGYTLSVTARALVNGVWTQATGPVTVPILDGEYMTSPTFTVPATLASGEDLVINIDPLENAESFDVTIDGPASVRNWENSSFYVDAERRTFTLDGVWVLPGTYTVSVTAEAEGFKESLPTTTTVTVTGDSIPGPSINPCGSTIVVRESKRITITAPGAEEVRYITIMDMGTWNNYNDNDAYEQQAGNFAFSLYWYNENYLGTMTVMARAKINGVWTGFGEPLTLLAVSADDFSAADMILPANLKRIEEYAFADCYAASVCLPEGLESIGSGAFSYCWNLKRINIPDSVTEIASDAFQHCWNLTLYGSANSLAQNYAEEYGFDYVELK